MLVPAPFLTPAMTMLTMLTLTIIPPAFRPDFLACPLEVMLTI